MLLTQDTPKGNYQIRSYQPGQITINDTVYTQSLVVTLTRLIVPWPPTTLTELNQTHLTILLEQQPEVVILGTGHSLVFPPPALFASLFERQIGVEVMDTAAACRTFNVLAAEGRKVVAALLLS